MSDTAYLLDRSFSWSLSQPMVVPAIVGQPSVGRSSADQPGGPILPLLSLQSSADQPGGPILPLLSLQLQPDLNVLTWTFTPQALQYVHIGIQIGRTLLN